MDNRKWLNRKYAKTFKKANAFLNDDFLYKFKKDKYKLGQLNTDTNGHKKGSLVMFKRTNPVTDYNYPMVYVVAKCNKKQFTASGYHSFLIMPTGFKEIFE